jgi:hypothetical protein
VGRSTAFESGWPPAPSRHETQPRRTVEVCSGDELKRSIMGKGTQKIQDTECCDTDTVMEG